MPAPSIPAGTLVADLVTGATYRNLRNRTYWHCDTAPETEVHLTVIADAIKTAFTPHLPNLLPENHAFKRVEVKYYGAGDTLIFSQSAAAEGPGLVVSPDHEGDDNSSDSEDIMPLETAIIVQIKTGLRGRSNQGRRFIGGISEKVQFQGAITPTFISTVKTLAGKFATDINVNGSGYTSTIHARHWNRKQNVMKPITKVYVVSGVGHRNDRRVKVMQERLT